VQKEIARINDGIANAYSIAQAKGAIMPNPNGRNIANLGATIQSIPAEGGGDVIIAQEIIPVLWATNDDLPLLFTRYSSGLVIFHSLVDMYGADWRVDVWSMLWQIPDIFAPKTVDHTGSPLVPSFPMFMYDDRNWAGEADGTHFFKQFLFGVEAWILSPAMMGMSGMINVVNALYVSGSYVGAELDEIAEPFSLGVAPASIGITPKTEILDKQSFYVDLWKEKLGEEIYNKRLRDKIEGQF